MNIKKYNEFYIKENEEIKEKAKEDEEIPFSDEKLEDEKLEDESDLENAEDDLEDSESDLIDAENDIDEVDDDLEESDELETPEYTDFDSYDKKMDDINSECKIVIINGCEPDSEIDKKTAEFKDKCGCECKEIYLYQLNIQAPKKQEPKDGMVQVYEALESASAIIFACQVSKNKINDSLEMAISRIKNYFKKEELKNKIFGAIIIGNEEKIKNDLILTALNDLHMVVCNDTLFFGDKGSNLTKMIDSISTLANAMSSIKKDGKIEAEEDMEDSDIDDTDEDEYVDSLKHMSNLGVDNNEEDMEEEEDRVIDNEDGTITQIHKGEEITEKIDTILPFDKFFTK